MRRNGRVALILTLEEWMEKMVEAAEMAKLAAGSP